MTPTDKSPAPSAWATSIACDIIPLRENGAPNAT